MGEGLTKEFANIKIITRYGPLLTNNSPWITDERPLNPIPQSLSKYWNEFWIILLDLIKQK